MSEALLRARTWAQTCRLYPLWQELARRMGASQKPVRRVDVSLDGRGRRELADLFAWSQLPPTRCRVSTAKLADALRLDGGELRQLVEMLAGPLGNRAADRAREADARRSHWAWLRGEAAAVDLPAAFARHVETVGAPGGEIAGHRALLRDLLQEVSTWPLSPPQPQAFVAERLTGEPHALDRGERGDARLRSLICQAAMTLDDRAGKSVERPAGHSPREMERAALRRQGIIEDEYGVSLIALGLRARPSSPLARLLNLSADVGEPVPITESQLRRWPITPADANIFVVENLSILAAAALRGWQGRPLVCTCGWPNMGGWLLLEQLRRAGVTLHYHSDIDPSGIQITQRMRQRVGAVPWRMDRITYLDNLSAKAPSWSESEFRPSWNPALDDAIRQHRCVLYEERVAGMHLEDAAS